MARPTAAIVLIAAALFACGPAEAPDAADGDGERASRAVGGAGSAGAPGSAAPSDTAAPSDSAHLLAREVMGWQGGREAWEDTRFLRFDWIVEQDGETRVRRSHAWARWEGDYRLSYERSDGSRFFALFDVQSLADDSVADEGRVWVDGEELTGARRDSALQNAYAAFVNDSYWLLMPLKWEDPGVHLAWEGRTELPDDSTYATVHLTFESGLGVTDDQYWGFVEPETGRMAAWRYHLQGREEKGPVIWWEDWQTFGPQGLKLALDRRWSEGDTRIRFEEVAADTAVPSGIFTPPGE